MRTNIYSLLKSANDHHYGQAAFNVNSVSQIKALIDIHETFNAPLLIQGAELSNGFMGGRKDFAHSTLEDKGLGAKNIAAAVKKYGKDAKIPIALHLDHGTSLESCIKMIEAGYTSVMIDGSSLPYEENVALTKSVVDYAHPLGVSVEGELGVLAGVEDNIFSEKTTYTHPLQALDFIERTGIDALAISYGTKHGANKGTEVKLRYQIVVAIRELLNHRGQFIGLVSHGSSSIPKYIVKQLNDLGGDISGTGGIPYSEISKAIDSGINKINVDSDIRLAVTRNLRKFFVDYPELKNDTEIGEIYQLLITHPTEMDPRVFITPIMNSIIYGVCDSDSVKELNKYIEQAVKEVAGQQIVRFDMVGKADFVDSRSLAALKAKPFEE